MSPLFVLLFLASAGFAQRTAPPQLDPSPSPYPSTLFPSPSISATPKPPQGTAGQGSASGPSPNPSPTPTLSPADKIEHDRIIAEFEAVKRTFEQKYLECEDELIRLTESVTAALDAHDHARSKAALEELKAYKIKSPNSDPCLGKTRKGQDDAANKSGASS